MKEHYSKPMVWHVALSSFMARFAPALNRLRSAFQSVMRDATAWDRDCKALHEATKGKQCRGTFNDYLRARCGDKP